MEPDSFALPTRGDSQGRSDMRLACSGVADQDDRFPLLDSFLYWPHADVHLGWEQFLMLVDPASACIASAQVNNGELVLGRRRGYLQVLEDEGVGVEVQI